MELRGAHCFQGLELGTADLGDTFTAIPQIDISVLQVHGQFSECT